ncbi:MAG: cytochrome c family protein [Geminicoccaceae bacterium]
MAGDVGAQAFDRSVVGGDPEAGRAVISRYGCGICHIIPGVRGARGTVGPSLAGFGDRNVIAGTVPNSPAGLRHWLDDPPAIAPDTMMPPMGLDADEIANAAAYLMSLRAE